MAGLLKKFKFTTTGGTVKLVWPCPDTENRVACHWPVIAMGFFDGPTAPLPPVYCYGIFAGEGGAACQFAGSLPECSSSA